MNWTAKEEKQVSRMTRYQVNQMTLKQLWIAAEYEKFQAADLLAQAHEISEGQELKDIIEHINSFEDETHNKGSWYRPPPTVRQ